MTEVGSEFCSVHEPRRKVSGAGAPKPAQNTPPSPFIPSPENKICPHGVKYPRPCTICDSKEFKERTGME